MYTLSTHTGEMRDEAMIQLAKVKSWQRMRDALAQDDQLPPDFDEFFARTRLPLTMHPMFANAPGPMATAALHSVGWHPPQSGQMPYQGAEFGPGGVDMSDARATAGQSTAGGMVPSGHAAQAGYPTMVQPPQPMMHTSAGYGSPVQSVSVASPPTPSHHHEHSPDSVNLLTRALVSAPAANTAETTHVATKSTEPQQGVATTVVPPAGQYGSLHPPSGSAGVCVMDMSLRHLDAALEPKAHDLEDVDNASHASVHSRDSDSTITGNASHSDASSVTNDSMSESEHDLVEPLWEVFRGLCRHWVYSYTVQTLVSVAVLADFFVIALVRMDSKAPCGHTAPPLP